MKKKTLCVLMVLFCFFTLIACQKQEEKAQEDKKEVTDQAKKEDLKEKDEDKNEEKFEIKFGAMVGPTGVGAANFIENSKKEGSKYMVDFSLASKPDELVSKLASGELDMAVIPANLASAVYNKTEGKIKALATNNLGVLYLVEIGDSINSLADLEGKEVISTGKGATPEVIFNYLMNKIGKNPESVQMNYQTEASEAAKMMISGKANLALVPEPMVTSILLKNKDARIALNINEIWEKEVPECKQITSVLVASKSFLEEKKDKTNLILNDYKESIETARAKPEETSKIVEELGIFKAPIIAKAMDKLNLEFISGQGLKDNLSLYLNLLAENNPKLVGGKIPDDNFYYTGK